MCPVKTAELIEMPFGGGVTWGPKEPTRRGIFWGCPGQRKALGVYAAVYVAKQIMKYSISA